MNRTKTPKAILFALWLLNRHIAKATNDHEIAAQIAAGVSTKQLIRLSGTVKEAEQLSKERKVRRRPTLENDRYIRMVWREI